MPFKTPLSTDFFTNRGKDFDASDVFDVKTLLGYVSAFVICPLLSGY